MNRREFLLSTTGLALAPSAVLAQEAGFTGSFVASVMPTRSAAKYQENGIVSTAA